MGIGIIFGVGAILALGVFAFFMMTIFRRVVPTNMVHIVQSSNKTTSFGKGKDAGNTYYAWPSNIPFIGVKVTEFPESIFQVSLSSYEAYDSARLPFMVDISAFFRVKDSDTVAQRAATFNELNEQLNDVLRGAVRRILATSELEAIMQERSSFGDQFTKEVETQIKEWGVLPVKTIEFMDIRDANGSQVIANIMSKEKSRIEMESRIVVAENKREADLKVIDAERTVEVQRQDAEQQVGLRTAEKDKTVGIAYEQSKQDIQEQAKITTEKDMAVLKVQEVNSAEIAKEVAIVKAEQDGKVMTVTAEAKKQVQVTEASANKETLTITAAGQLEASKKDAEGITVMGVAKAEAEKAMLMAPIDTQITLAKEIGENEGYQTYLITIKQVEASQAVGIELAKAMEKADMKIIANSGDVQSGMNSLGDMFTAKGGVNLSAMMEGLSTTDAGKALVEKVTGSDSKKSNLLKEVKSPK